MQKLLEDERAARQLLQEQIIALQKAQAATPAAKKSVAPSLSSVTPDEGAQKGMASSLTVGGVAVTNGLRYARLTMFAQQLSLGGTEGHGASAPGHVGRGSGEVPGSVVNGMWPRNVKRRWAKRLVR